MLRRVLIWTVFGRLKSPVNLLRPEYQVHERQVKKLADLGQGPVVA